MAPRTRYPRRRILEAATALTRAAGIDAVSARAVAAELGCSTAPIFTAFESMEALHEALLDQLIERFVAAIDVAQGPDPLFAAGYGMVRFAADEPRLFEALFLRPHLFATKWNPVRRTLARHMGDHSRYAHLAEQDRFGLVGRASIVFHGLAVEVWFRRLPRPSGEDLSRLLEELAGPLVDASIANGWTTDIHAS